MHNLPATSNPSKHREDSVMMHLIPILKILWRSKAGPSLVIIQLALTVAIISNALFFIQTRIEQLTRPTGFAESQLIRLWIKEGPNGPDLKQRVALDIEHLRSLPGIRDIAPVGSVPFSHAGYSSGFANRHESEGEAGRLRTSAAVVEADHRALDVLGLKLIAGRNFLPDEGVYFTRDAMPTHAQAIVTESVAVQIFPQQSAVGKTIYMAGQIPLTVVGVVQDFLGYFPDLDFAQRNVLISAIEDTGSINYLLRSDSEELDSVLDEATRSLRELDMQRIVDSTSTLEELIADHYSRDRAMIILLSVVIILLTFINMLGIVGITMFRVNQRRRETGIRRALGATRAGTVIFFLLENTLLAGAAITLGAMIALWSNFHLVQHYAFELLPWFYIPLSGLTVLCIALAAATIPAYKAAFISPRAAIELL